MFSLYLEREVILSTLTSCVNTRHTEVPGFKNQAFTERFFAGDVKAVNLESGKLASQILLG